MRGAAVLVTEESSKLPTCDNVRAFVEAAVGPESDLWVSFCGTASGLRPTALIA